MKTFGVLAAATLLLIVAGFRFGAFSPAGDEQAAVATPVANKASCSCCEDGDKPATASCCETETAGSAGCSRCEQCQTTSAGANTTACDGSCGKGGACCQDGNVSRVAAIGAVSTDIPGDSSLAGSIATKVVQEEAIEASGITGDWPMWGGTIYRNMVNDMDGISLDFDLRAGKRVNWVANLGSQTYGNAIVAGGKVFVGCNNGAVYRPQHEGDKGCVICFDEQTGEFVWQLTREKLTSGRVNDWPLQGICSTPAIEFSDEEGGRLWVITNRCELMCIDVDGFADGNDGVQDEVDSEAQDADILWNLDMIDELGVFPHNLATSSPVVYEDMVYVLTSNGVDEAHLELPSPRAPSFLAINKNTGKVVWESNQPFDAVLHGQWSSPTVGVVNGKAQVYFPGGDGWLYALDARTGEEIWKFDLNPKDTLWELGGRGSRNAVISTAVFMDNSVLIAVGQDPEHGEGVGHLWRIDATKTGDISPELGEIGAPGVVNPKSGVIWHYGGVDADSRSIFRRTMSTVSVTDGLVFAADLSGYVHCIDYDTGARHWEHDLLTGVWGSTMVADGKVFLGTEEGTLIVFAADGTEARILATFDTINNSSIYSTPTIANGKMYLTDRTRLYSIEIQDDAGKDE